MEVWRFGFDNLGNGQQITSSKHPLGLFASGNYVKYVYKAFEPKKPRSVIRQ